MPKLERSSKIAQAGYEWAKKNFDEHVQALGPWFQEKVKQFETGLAEFQHDNKGRFFRWEPIHYLDGEMEYC
jgi:hypothetical protein